MSTIYALSSAPGPAGVAVVRVSGPQAGAAVRALAGKLPQARRATLTALRTAAGELLDRGLILWFPAPASVTGEDVAEFHVHGGRALVRAVLDALATVPGLDFAEPGDFTRRAFHNGKLDLTQVEAIADLIDAETEGQRRQATRQMEGALGQRLESWRQEVLRALAHVEASIDFADDEVPADALVAVERRVAALAEEMDDAIRDSKRSQTLRTGVRIAIVGAPNVGKSSLLNALVGREAAIVSAHAGTTRDVVEVRIDLGGVPVTIADTAGLRDSHDEVEAEGIRRARAAARDADLRIAVLDAPAWPAVDPATIGEAGPRAVFVLNKSDVRTIPCAQVNGHPAWSLSAKTGGGIRPFVRGLTTVVSELAGETADPGLTRDRHRDALEGCVRSLRRFQDGRTEVALRAEELRLASRSLGRITGRVDVEDLLEVVFRDFCIGK